MYPCPKLPAVPFVSPSITLTPVFPRPCPFSNLLDMSTLPMLMIFTNVAPPPGMFSYLMAMPSPGTPKCNPSLSPPLQRQNSSPYIHLVLQQISFAQPKPTLLFEDNISAIRMINAMKPTKRSCHIDIQYFAIQDWCRQGHLELRHIPDIINPAEDLTKALDWVLHSHHARHFMGHFGPPILL